MYLLQFGILKLEAKQNNKNEMLHNDEDIFQQGNIWVQQQQPEIQEAHSTTTTTLATPPSTTTTSICTHKKEEKEESCYNTRIKHGKGCTNDRRRGRESQK